MFFVQMDLEALLSWEETHLPNGAWRSLDEKDIAIRKKKIALAQPEVDRLKAIKDEWEHRCMVLKENKFMSWNDSKSEWWHAHSDQERRTAALQREIEWNETGRFLLAKQVRILCLLNKPHSTRNKKQKKQKEEAKKQQERSGNEKRYNFR